MVVESSYCYGFPCESGLTSYVLCSHRIPAWNNSFVLHSIPFSELKTRNRTLSPILLLLPRYPLACPFKSKLLTNNTSGLARIPMNAHAFCDHLPSGDHNYLPFTSLLYKKILELFAKLQIKVSYISVNVTTAKSIDRLGSELGKANVHTTL